MKLKVFIFSNESGSQEYIYFTDDLDITDDDICFPESVKLNNETIIEAKHFPSSFPLYCLLRRE